MEGTTAKPGLGPELQPNVAEQPTQLISPEIGLPAHEIPQAQSITPSENTANLSKETLIQPVATIVTPNVPAAPAEKITLTARATEDLSLGDLESTMFQNFNEQAEN